MIDPDTPIFGSLDSYAELDYGFKDLKFLEPYKQIKHIDWSWVVTKRDAYDKEISAECHRLYYDNYLVKSIEGYEQALLDYCTTIFGAKAKAYADGTTDDYTSGSAHVCFFTVDMDGKLHVCSSFHPVHY